MAGTITDDQVSKAVDQIIREMSVCQKNEDDGNGGLMDLYKSHAQNKELGPQVARLTTSCRIHGAQVRNAFKVIAHYCSRAVPTIEAFLDTYQNQQDYAFTSDQLKVMANLGAGYSNKEVLANRTKMLQIILGFAWIQNGQLMVYLED